MCDVSRTALAPLPGMRVNPRVRLLDLRSPGVFVAGAPQFRANRFNPSKIKMLESNRFTATSGNRTCPTFWHDCGRTLSCVLGGNDARASPATSRRADAPRANRSDPTNPPPNFPTTFPNETSPTKHLGKAGRIAIIAFQHYRSPLFPALPSPL